MSLQAKLGGILFLGICLALAGQVFTNQFFEVPAHLALQDQSDLKDVNRVKQALLALEDSLRRTATDYAAWDVSYEFVELDETDPRRIEYIESNFDNYSLYTYGVDGVVYYNKAGEVIYRIQHDRLRTPLELKFDDLPFETAVDPALIAAGNFDDELISSGLLNTNIGTIAYSAAHIVPHTLPYPEPKGVLIFWHAVDDKLVSKIEANLNSQLSFIEIDEARKDFELATALTNVLHDRDRILPRDEDDFLYWILDDVAGEPVLLVQQKAEKPIFSTSWLTESVIVGFLISTLLLLILMQFFSRLVIRRMHYAKNTMLKITASGDYENQLVTTGNDEIDQVFTQFNQLLARISAQNRELSELSNQDALTGIANRRHLDEVLNRTWRQCARTRSLLSVLMIDIDYFKLYNDRYGHPAGDQVLIKVAQTFQHNLHRATDYLARYGGEEFCAILTDTDAESARSVAERLRNEIYKLGIPSEVSKCADVVTVSIGIASFIPDSKVVEMDIVKAADEALYRAKEQGRNRVYSSLDGTEEAKSDHSA